MLLETLRKFMRENGYKVQEFSIPGLDSMDTYHSCVVDKLGAPMSGGFGRDRGTARKIAIAEFIERLEVLKIRSSGELVQKEWGLDQIPTACGFAVGFNLHNTIYRSIGEALERWVISQWIDNGLHIAELIRPEIEAELDDSSRILIAQFEEVRYFSKSVLVAVNDKLQEFRVTQTMAYFDGGIFPGSAVRKVNGSPWQHAILESYRNLLAFQNNSGPVDSFPANKVHFFARNRRIADQQIANAQKMSWPTPTISLHLNESRFGGEAFLARTIVDGWKPWNQGPLERFLY